ncbi:hypothetical protein B0H16DRAFT_1700565 [Mycena metata]|uniref:Uncharacterized protein n=1 Tax=Mycena metata TaxID=1033252 RepID=A0AAD7MIA6_9AGAR|nr:hypothetical protein B0H16DRAFT_1700565 [Mycena metata]
MYYTSSSRARQGPAKVSAFKQTNGKSYTGISELQAPLQSRNLLIPGPSWTALAWRHVSRPVYVGRTACELDFLPLPDITQGKGKQTRTRKRDCGSKRQRQNDGQLVQPASLRNESPDHFEHDTTFSLNLISRPGGVIRGSQQVLARFIGVWRPARNCRFFASASRILSTSCETLAATQLAETRVGGVKIIFRLPTTLFNGSAAASLVKTPQARLRGVVLSFQAISRTAPPHVLRR